MRAQLSSSTHPSQVLQLGAEDLVQHSSHQRAREKQVPGHHHSIGQGRHSVTVAPATSDSAGAQLKSGLGLE